MQAGTVSRLRFCRRSWGLNIPLLEEHCAFLGSHTFVPISWMCNRTVQQNQKSFLWGLMVTPHLIYGIWSLQFLGTRIRVRKNRATCWWTNVKFVHHLTRFTNVSNLEEWSMIWIMLFLLPQTSSLHIRKLCCMCLKTTKQWSRWS